MNRSERGALCTLGLVAILAGCSGLTKSPTQGLVFTAPAGFASKASMLGVMQVWTADDDNQVLMLLRLPTSINMSDALKNANLKDSKILARRTITICGKQPATYMEVTGTRIEAGGRSHDDRADIVYVRGASDTMFSLYAYPRATKPNPAAQAALRGLCAKPAAGS
ncbi:MAG: hypothetical protein ACYDGM_14330 [Vulcanimicrobiaceae bacterium]